MAVTFSTGVNLEFDLSVVPAIDVGREVRALNATAFLIDVSYSKDIYGRGQEKLILEFKTSSPPVTAG